MIHLSAAGELKLSDVLTWMRDLDGQRTDRGELATYEIQLLRKLNYLRTYGQRQSNANGDAVFTEDDQMVVHLHPDNIDTDNFGLTWIKKGSTAVPICGLLHWSGPARCDAGKPWPADGEKGVKWEWSIHT